MNRAEYDFDEKRKWTKTNKTGIISTKKLTKKKHVVHKRERTHENGCFTLHIGTKFVLFFPFIRSDSYSIFECIRKHSEGIVPMNLRECQGQGPYRCMHIVSKPSKYTRNFDVAFYGLSVIYLFFLFVCCCFIQFDFHRGFCFMPNPSVHSTHQPK